MFLFASTTSRTSNALLGWNCGYTFTSNVMYGVLYAVSPELFPTKNRGTGNAIVASASRVFGSMVSLFLSFLQMLLYGPRRDAGSNYRTEGESGDVGAHLGCRRIVPRGGLYLVIAAVRVEGKSLDLRVLYCYSDSSSVDRRCNTHQPFRLRC